VADYVGAARVVMQQVGSAGAAGRPGSLRCNWTRVADGRTAGAARFGTGGKPLAGAQRRGGQGPGFRPASLDRGDGAERIVARHRDKVRAAMMALVEQVPRAPARRSGQPASGPGIGG